MENLIRTNPHVLKQKGLKTNAEVYIITAGPFIKVGMTQHLAMRLRDLATGCPYNTELIWVSDRFPRKQAAWLEQQIHIELRPHHHKGEWFSANPYVAVEDAKKIQQKLKDLDKRQNDPNHLCYPQDCDPDCPGYEPRMLTNNLYEFP